MNRTRIAFLAVVSLLALSSRGLNADVRTDEKGRVEFAGLLGKVVNLFGSKSAKEGTTSTHALKGDRLASTNDMTGQIIDLGEEKVYDLDVKKKTYKVTTFAELRKRMEDTRRKAEENARKEQAQPQAQAKDKPPAQENNIEVDFDVKNTGQKKTINGFDTHQVVMTITLREKGTTLEQGGGMVLTSDMWLAPRIAAMKEIAEFYMRYARQLEGPQGVMLPGTSAEGMAAAMAAYPMMKLAIAKMNGENVKLDGTAIQTTITVDSVRSAEDMASAQKSTDDDTKVSPSGGVGGLMGGFARRVAKKKTEGDTEPSARSTVLTITDDVLKVTTDVSATDVGVPAGFKESR